MLNKKTIGISIIATTIIAASLYLLPLANAAAGDPLYLPVCKEGVNPFLLGGTLPTGDTSPYLNVLSESVCKQHSPYPNAHYTLTENDKALHPVTQAAINDNIHAPYTRHHHRYYNNSLEDDYFYKSYIAKFEITVESDGFTNTQLNELKCPYFTGQTGTVYNNFTNCVDQAYDPDHFGGIRLHRKTVGNTVVLTWEFGVNGQGGRPWTPGINPSIDITPAPGYPIKFPFNTEDPVQRRWAEYAQMKTKENLPQSIWSATTTSRVLIADAAIHRSAVSTNPSIDRWNVADPTCMQGWCLLDPDNYSGGAPTEIVYSNGVPKKYYWFPIGTVSTVWNAPTQEASYCTGLELTAPGTLVHLGGNIYRYLPNEDATFQVLPSFSNGPVPLDYKWNAKELKVDLGNNYLPAPGGLQIQSFNPTDLFAATPGLEFTTSPISGVQISPGLQAAITSYGLFYDSETERYTNPSSGRNPYVDKGGVWFDDRLTYYTGGPGGTSILVQGVDPTTELYVGNNCEAVIYIPPPEEQNTCINLEIDPDSIEPYTPVTFTVTPEFEDPSDAIPLDYYWKSSSQSPQSINPGFEAISPSNQIEFKPVPVDPDQYMEQSQIPFDPGIFQQRMKNLSEQSQIPFDPGAVVDIGQTNILAQLPAGLTLEEVQPQLEIAPAATQLELAPTTPQVEIEPAVPSIDLTPSVAPQLEVAPTPELEIAPANQLELEPALQPTALPQPGVQISPIDPSALPDLFKAVMLGFFEDFLGAGDLANPYWERTDNKTHYTGGSPGTWITVQAYSKDGTLFPLCSDSLRIPPTPVEECLDLEIYRNGQQMPDTISSSDPTDDMYATISTNPPAFADELEYVWETTSGTLSGSGQSGQQVVTADAADLVDLTGAAEGTVLTVYARNPSDPNKVYLACADQLTMEGAICLDLQLSNSNPDLKANESTTLKADPVNQDPPHPNYVNWSEQGEGHFELGPSSQSINSMVPGTCPTPPAVTNQSFTAPKECDYIYYAGPNGGGSFRVEAEPNVGGVADCIYEYTVPAGPEMPYCIDLNIDPQTINRGDRTNYTGTATFSDGKTYNIDVDWSGQNGQFSNGATFHRQENESSGGFVNYFDHSPAEAGGRVEVEVSKVYDNDVSNDFSLCTESIEIPPTEKECTYLYLTWPSDDLVCVGTDHEGNFIWGKNGDEWESDELCIEADRDEDTITVEAVGYEEVCSDEFSPEERPPEYELIKKVNIENDDPEGFTTKIQTIPQDHTTVYYQIVFTPKGADTTTVRITDDISKGFLTAEILPVDKAGNVSPGEITYEDDLTVTEEGYGELQECSDLDLEEDDDEEPEHCYNGDIGTGGGIELVRIEDEVTIQYQASVESGLTDEICRDGQVCEEKYRNRASAKVTEVNGESVDIPTFRSNDILIQIFCQYILTQAAGDIFLERDLSYGVDIQQCSEITTSPGIVITPGAPEIPAVPKTGVGDTEIFTISHELCTSGLAGELPPELQNIYGQDVIPRLSGQICEVKLRTGTVWQQSFITNSIDENKTRLSRWGYDYQKANTNMNEITIDPNYQAGSQNVYHINGDLTIDYSDYVLSDGEGAKTFIVEDGDLIINKNIKYGECIDQPCTVRDTASLAFIVLNGSVYIDPSVTEIAGVYFVQEGDKTASNYNANSGRFYSGSPSNFDQDSYETLKVTGSIYGDIDPLFGNRLYAGDPTLGQGGLVIRFDERIILNTPPGLRDVLNLSATEVAR